MTWFKPEAQMSPKLWWVCFSGMRRRRWWECFLRPGYRHASLLGYLPGVQMWLQYEVLFHRTDISLISPELAGHVLSTAQMEGGVLSWPAGKWEPPSCGFRFGMWCVPAIKHVLGLRCVALTPHGLHDWLLRNGGRPLLPEEDHEPVRNAKSA